MSSRLSLSSAIDSSTSEEGRSSKLQNSNYIVGNATLLPTGESRYPSSEDEADLYVHYPMNATGYYRGTWERQEEEGIGKEGDEMVRDFLTFNTPKPGTSEMTIKEVPLGAGVYTVPLSVSNVKYVTLAPRKKQAKGGKNDGKVVDGGGNTNLRGGKDEGKNNKSDKTNEGKVSVWGGGEREERLHERIQACTELG